MLRRSRSSPEPIVAAMRQADPGTPIADMSRKRDGESGAPEFREPRRRRNENAR